MGVTQLRRCRGWVTGCCGLFNDALSPVELISEVNFKKCALMIKVVGLAYIKALFQYCLEKNGAKNEILISQCIANLRRRVNRDLPGTKQAEQEV